MTHRAAVITATAITAFVMVIVGGIAAVLALPLANAAGPAQPEPPAPAAAAPAGSAQAAISPETAGQIALAAAPGARFDRQPELVMFQGAMAYEVPLDQGAVYVDANTGQVLHNGAAQSGQWFGEDDEHDEHDEDDEDDEHDDWDENEYEG